LIEARIEEVIFGPEENISDFVIGEINKAKNTVDIMAFWFTWLPIAESVVMASKRGVKVKIIVDERSVEKKQKDVHKNEIEVVPYFLDNNLRNMVKIYSGELLHYKTVLIDDNIVLNGTCNFFNGSLNRHEEHYMKIISKELKLVFDKQFNKLWNEKSYLAEGKK
jgi:phosphatidylserine/phosphatidylglycerophosphate/cardiolipin synthase-like enzyme